MLINGDCLDVLKTLETQSIDALVTDPPAGISFMGKAWDSDKGGRDAWIEWMMGIMQECARVMKPGAHGLVWALPRTSHWTATALEDAGFEVRDVITHLFGSGFPKSLNIEKAGAGKEWQGWGTALKPASEHWILIRKPCSEKTVAANVLKHGCGGINIDASRIRLNPGDKKGEGGDITKSASKSGGLFGLNTSKRGMGLQFEGRFPANLVLDEEAAKLLDEQSGVLSPGHWADKTIGFNTREYKGQGKRGDSGGASRFFYCAKISLSERGEGNSHPTVKPKKLMHYLITLITPPNGVVLDPFMGSGSTGVAAKEAGFQFIGIEKDPEYFEIAVKRYDIN